MTDPIVPAGQPRRARPAIFNHLFAAVWIAGLFLVEWVPGAAAASLEDALVNAYRTNPQLNADRARQRATDENVPQALAGYRPQIVASLSAGLQVVRNLLPDNTVQGATLRPWTIGVTVTQVLFDASAL